MLNSTLTQDFQAVAVDESAALLANSRPELDDRRVPPRRVASTLVGSAARDRKFQTAIDRVVSCLSLSKNWDLDGGNPADRKSVMFAIRLLREVWSTVPIHAPVVCPISGGVYLEWRLADCSLYFEIDSDSVLCVIRRGNRMISGAEDPEFDVRQAVAGVAAFCQQDRAFPIA